MQRRAFVLGLAGVLTAGLPALADNRLDPATQVVAELTRQSYSDIKVYTTWLGRVRILAHRDGGVREIVLNPRTGEILRDLWTASNGSEQTVSILDDVNSSNNSRSGSSSGGTSDRKSSAGGTSSGTSGGTSTGDGGSDGSGDGHSDGGGSGGGSDGGASGGTDDGASAGVSVGGSNTRTGSEDGARLGGKIDN